MGEWAAASQTHRLPSQRPSLRPSQQPCQRPPPMTTSLGRARPHHAAFTTRPRSAGAEATTGVGTNAADQHQGHGGSCRPPTAWFRASRRRHTPGPQGWGHGCSHQLKPTAGANRSGHRAEHRAAAGRCIQHRQNLSFSGWIHSHGACPEPLATAPREPAAAGTTCASCCRRGAPFGSPDPRKVRPQGHPPSLPASAPAAWPSARTTTAPTGASD